MQYTVIIERTDNSFGAYVPDLDGCVAIGETETEVVELIKEAIESHIELLKEESAIIPSPNAKAMLLEIN